MSRQHRRRRRPSVPDLPLERIARGESGERALQDWLDRSRLAYLFLDQTPLTIPASCRADLKRPDFLVAIDHGGTVAIDAKAKSFIDGCFVLNLSERRRLDGFETRFGTPVWYACFPPGEPGRCYLFRNRALMGAIVAFDPAKQIIRVPIGHGVAVETAAISFTAAILQADAIDCALPASRTSQAQLAGRSEQTRLSIGGDRSELGSYQSYKRPR